MGDGTYFGKAVYSALSDLLASYVITLLLVVASSYVGVFIVSGKFYMITPWSMVFILFTVNVFSGFGIAYLFLVFFIFASMVIYEDPKIRGKLIIFLSAATILDVAYLKAYSNL